MKKYLMLFFCSVFVIFPNVIYAKKSSCSNGVYNATLEIGKDRINLNEKVNVSISSENEYKANFKLSNNNVVNFKEDGALTGNEVGETTITSEIIFYKDDEEVGKCKISIPIEVVSSDAFLKKLTLEEYDMSAIFQSDVFEYTIKLPYNVEKINIVAEANDINAKITGDGRRYINDAENEFKIIVTAGDNSFNTYKIIVEREEANSDSTLKSLNIEGYVLSPFFKKEEHNYALEVGKDVNDIKINAIPSYEYAEVNGIGTYTLASGKNEFKITVRAENGTEEIYTIIVKKNKGLSLLKKLNINNGEIDSSFKEDKFIYKVSVSNDILALDIKTEANEFDKIEVIGNEKLKEGKNEIIIRVTGEDKGTTTYKLLVNKLSKEEEIKIEKNDKLLKILFIVFIVSIVLMVGAISAFLINHFKNKNLKLKNKNRNNKRK